MKYNLEDPSCIQFITTLCSKTEKSQEDLLVLCKILQNLPILGHEGRETLRRLEKYYELEQLNSIQIKKLKRFEAIYKKGEESNRFYILVQGKVSFFDQDQKHLIFTEKPVVTYENEGFFGQYHILYSMKPLFTAMAMVKDTYVISLDKKQFLKFFSYDCQIELQKVQNLFEQQHMFKELKFNLMIKCISSLQKMSLKKGEILYSENQRAENMYFVLQGEVVLVKFYDKVSGQGMNRRIHFQQQQSKIIKQGGIFGTRELEGDESNQENSLRQATAKASKDNVIVYKMNKIIYRQCLEQNKTLENDILQGIFKVKQRKSSFTITGSFLVQNKTNNCNDNINFSSSKNNSGLGLDLNNNFMSRTKKVSMGKNNQLKLPSINKFAHQKRSSFQSNGGENVSVNQDYWKQLIQMSRQKGNKEQAKPNQNQVDQKEKEQVKFKVNIISCDSTDSEEKIKVIEGKKKNINKLIKKGGGVKKSQIKKSNLIRQK